MTKFEEFVDKNRSLFDSLKAKLCRSVFDKGVAPSTSYLKSASKSTEYRTIGNECYGARRYHGALKWYDTSIAFAPIDSEQLALGFGNRSAALYRLEKYDLCLLDINRALKLSAVETVKEKLMKRKEECWMRLQEHSRIPQVRIVLVIYFFGIPPRVQS